MKRFIIILTLLTAAIVTNSKATDSLDFKEVSDANSHDMLHLFLERDDNIANNKINSFKTELDEFIQQIANKKQRFKSERRLLEYVFYKTHRKFLKNYQLYSSFTDLIENKNYDCVAGTALYALLLESLDIEYKIKEFDYHVLLIANTSSGEVLFESTDPINGFVKDKPEIKKRIHFYTKQAEEVSQLIPLANTKERLYQKSYAINNNIDIKKLAGLQYYNMAVKSYDNNAYVQAIKNLEKGIVHYNSSRFQEFLSILLDNVERDSTVDAIEINHYINKYPQRALVKK